MMISKFSTYLLAGTALVAVTMPVSAPRADDKDDGSTTVQLNADAHRKVEQDRVQATLAIEVVGQNPTTTQADVNTKMQAAKKLYDAVTEVKTTTGSYTVYKDYQPEPAPKKDGTPAWTPEEREKHALWRGSQEIILDGAKKDDMLKLIADLQKQGFATHGLNFYMSREASDAVKDQLIVEALGNIKARAENIRQALGMKTIRYATINLNSNDGGYQPMPMMARAMAKGAEMDVAVPTPVAEAGETDVTMNVSAEVKLK